MNAQTTFNLLWSHRISGVVHVSVSPDGQRIAAVSSETGAYAFAADGRQLWSAKRPASGQGWTTHEQQNAQARAFREKEEYILPVRLDDTEIPGLRKTVGYVDLREKTIDEVCRLVLRKLSS